MQPVVVGLNIKQVSVETLEALSIHHSVNELRLRELAALTQAQGVCILSTCNRLEFYAVAPKPQQCAKAMREYLTGHDSILLPAQAKELGEHLYSHEGVGAVRHLYRVAAGLDSLVVGETEILGQVARAYERARCAQVTGKVLNVWFQRALAVGKLVRTQFGVDRFHTSVGRIAVDLAERELGSLAQKQILILGAGEMSELTMKHLLSKAVSLVMVSNRSLPKAQALAAEYGFAACPLDDLTQCLTKADVVFSATSSKHCLITKERLAAALAAREPAAHQPEACEPAAHGSDARQQDACQPPARPPDAPARPPLVCIDMAVPRDIDPRAAELAGVRCFDIKQLQEVSARNQEQRMQVAARIETVVNQKAEEFEQWLATSCALAQPAHQCTAKKLRLGTRGSKLALWQANWVAARLKEHHSTLDIEIVTIATRGEQLLENASARLDKGLFTSELEDALLTKNIDVAVHSLKDLPTVLPDGLMLGAYCKREDPRDALVTKSGCGLEQLPAGARVGTASVRRQAQLRHLRPDICCANLRGNIDTRLRKLQESQELSGIIVAAAGLIRLGWQERICQYLNEEDFLPAPGQGVIALEVARGNEAAIECVAALNHHPTEQEACAERQFLQELAGGCQLPVGARAIYHKGELELRGMVARLDGSQLILASAFGADPSLVGSQAAELALKKGVAEILAELRQPPG